MKRLTEWGNRQFYSLKRFRRIERDILDRTMYWHDILSDFIDTMDFNISVKNYEAIQELRRDIGHFRIDLMSGKMERLGHNFNEKQEE